MPIVNPLRKLLFGCEKSKGVEERLIAKLADAVTGVSSVDADYFKALTNDRSKIDVFSNVVFVEDYTKPVTTNIKLQPKAALIGSFGHKNSPMDRVADWTVNQIMPRLACSSRCSPLYYWEEFLNSPSKSKFRQSYGGRTGTVGGSVFSTGRNDHCAPNSSLELVSKF